MKPTPRRATLALALVALATLGALGARWVAAVSADPRPSVLGARLGMTADDVRARIDARGPGRWSSSIVAGDWVLEHHGQGDDTRFEIHEGQLVAIRAEGPASSDLPSEPELEVTSGSVLVREVRDGRVRITLLSRACPTHHAEAEALAGANVSEP